MKTLWMNWLEHITPPSHGSRLISMEDWLWAVKRNFHGETWRLCTPPTTDSRNSPKEYVGHFLLIGETVPDSGETTHYKVSAPLTFRPQTCHHDSELGTNRLVMCCEVKCRSAYSELNLQFSLFALSLTLSLFAFLAYVSYGTLKIIYLSTILTAQGQWSLFFLKKQ